ncbi:unnamed protein product [Rotaria sp. Silwood1]|nr:unnamed protein product [Rotaria sp. Silwood1]
MALRSTTASSNEQTLYGTHRKAVDCSGSLGSLYDGYKDQILLKVNVNSKRKRCQEHKSKHCMVINASKDQQQSILKIIGLEDELRLSLLLNLREKTGISAFLDYSYPINEYTWFFYYYSLDREEELSNDTSNIQSFDKSSKLQIVATHIITGIQTGIDVLVVLQLPSRTGTIKTIKWTAKTTTL